MKKYKTAALSVVLTFVLFIIIGSFLGRIQSDSGDFIFMTVILFPPLFVLSICTEYIFNWLFNKWTYTKQRVRISLALLISSSISVGYLMMAWLIFGDFKLLVNESIEILMIIVLVVTLKEVFTRTQVEIASEKHEL